MTTIMLSGVGGSTNWLPLVLPLVAFLLLLQFGQVMVHFIKAKLHHYSRPGNDQAFTDEAGTHEIE